jgi:O-antigen/teichoic acid export membrane protein
MVTTRPRAPLTSQSAARDEVPPSMTTRPRRRALVAALGYVLEQTSRLALIAVVGVFIARYLGPGGLGLLSFATGVFGLLAPITLLGMRQVLIREFSRGRDWRSVLSSALAIQLPVAVVAAAVGFLIITVSRGFHGTPLVLALVLFPTPLLGLSDTARAYLECIGRVRWIVLTGVVAAVMSATLKVAGLATNQPVWVFAVIGTLEGTAVCCGLFGGLLVGGAPRWLWRKLRVRQYLRRDVAVALLRESWPLLLASVAVTVYMEADILMLGVIAGNRETGLYAAAANLSEVW